MCRYFMFLQNYLFLNFILFQVSLSEAFDRDVEEATQNLLKKEFFKRLINKTFLESCIFIVFKKQNYKTKSETYRNF